MKKLYFSLPLNFLYFTVQGFEQNILFDLLLKIYFQESLKHIYIFFVRTHMEDMIEVTKAIHYENYRRLKLTEKKRTSPSPASSTGEVAASV